MTDEDPPFKDLADEQRSIPARSKLYNLTPEGIGTWRIESLASYLSRLAHAHGVKCRTLASTVSKAMPDHLKRSNERGWDEMAIPSNTLVTDAWNDALKTLSPREDLDVMTLAILKGRVSVRGLLHTNRRWCPLCMQEDYSRAVPYRYLIWEVGVVEACPSHGITLISGCSCGDLKIRTHPVESWSHECPKCGDRIDQVREDTLREASPSALRRAVIIREALEDPLFVSRPNGLPADGFAVFLRRLLSRLPRGGQRHLAQLTGLEASSFFGWKTRRHLPTLKAIISFSEIYGLPLFDVLSGNGEPIELFPVPLPPKRPHRFPKNSKARKLATLERIQVALMAQGPVDPIPAWARLAKLAGVHPATLNSWFPRLARIYGEVIAAQQSELRMNRRLRRLEEFRLVAVGLAEMGICPTRSRVSVALKGHGVWMLEERGGCDEICREIRAKFGITIRNGIESGAKEQRMFQEFMKNCGKKANGEGLVRNL